jgi:hypothetical protein
MKKTNQTPVAQDGPDQAVPTTKLWQKPVMRKLDASDAQSGGADAVDGFDNS